MATLGRIKPRNFDTTGDYVANSITTTGNVSAANIKTNNILYANGAAYSFSASPGGSNTQLQFNDANSFAGSANLTFDKTTNTLSVTNLLISTANISGTANLGTVANVKILGGSNTQLLSTDGTGNLSWTNQVSLTGYATESYVGNAVANLVNSAPAVLDTLGELSNALGNDASFSTTITNSLANKFNTADFNSTANSWISTQTTSNLSEGTNLYYTTARANTAIDARVTKTFVDNLAVVANIANIANSVVGSNVSGQVSNSLIAGTVYTNAQPNITSVGTLSALAVTGNITSGNANLGNLVTANFFAGNGSSLSAIAGANVTGAVGLATFAATANAVAGSNVSGIVPAASKIENGTSNINTPATNGNITVGIGGVSNTVVFTTEGITVAGKITTGSGTGGNITGANVIGANFFVGSGNNLSNIQAANITGQVSNALIAGTVYTNAQPNITSVGTLTSLSVTGALAAGDATITGNLTVNGTTITANVTSMVVKDPIIEQGGNTSGALTTNDGKDRGQLLHYYSGAVVDAFMGWDNSNAEFAFGSNVSVSSDVVTFNTLGNVRANVYFGNGSGLTNLAGANVTGAVSFAAVANSVAVANVSGIGNIATANLDGNASNILYGNGVFSGVPATYGNSNVTTLLSSYGSNTITTTGNITANYFIGNGSSLTGISAATAISLINGNSNVIVNANSNVTISAIGNANIVTVTGTGVNVSGYTNVTGNLVVGEKSNLGPAANVIITGGTTGQYLKTDGTGNLSWDTVSGGGGGGGGGTAYTAAATPLASGNVAGDMWYNTSTDVLYEYISDGTSSYWVDVQTSTISSANTTAYVSRSYTANGSGTTYTVTSGANVHNVLVYLNGIAQLPTTDYTISGSTLTFDSAPANSTLIFIRELMPPLVTTISQTIGNLTVSTTANAGSLNITGVSNLGAIGNVKITGGTSGQLISTDGTGNLTFTSASGTTRAQAVIMGIIFGG